MKRSYKGKNVQDLMAALITGNLTNRILSYQFSSLGLQHLLAISGFHFALITLFLAFILKRLFPEKVMAASIIFIITAYFLYMGNSPSISRAWIGVIIFLVGTLFSFRPTPLNALGVALLLQLTLNPLVVTQISFQLSFGATLGILLLYKRINQLLEPILPKRPFHVLRKLSHIDQWGYLGCAYIRNVIALNGAVLTFTLPLLLLHFKTFPLLSIVYNFFFPLLFTFLIGGLLLGLFIPGISTLNNYYANFLLTLTANAPKRLMFQLHLLDACVIALFIAICVITLQIYRKKLTKKSVISHLRKRRLL